MTVSRLVTFKELGVELQTVSLPDDLPVDALSIILDVEAAAAFDQLTRSNRMIFSYGRVATPGPIISGRPE